MKTTDNSSVVDQLREILKLTGISQKELAEMMDLKPSQMNLYFKDKSKMRADRFIDLLEILGIDVLQMIENRLNQLRHSSSSAQLDQSLFLVKLDRVKGTTRKSLKELIELLGA